MTNSDVKNSTLRHLTSQFAQHGKLQAIYLRPARGENCESVISTQALGGKGLLGDRASKTASRNPLGSNRQVTLIQAEHINVISALLGKTVDAGLLRRNLVVSGINLIATKSLFKDQTMMLIIGEVVLEITGACEPCSKMEKLLGKGAYNAMRGHSGVNARVLKGGDLSVGEQVSCIVKNNRQDC